MVIIPHSVKIGTIVGMGLQIAIVGMTSIDLVVGSNFTLITLGDLANYKIWVSIFGLLIIGTLSYHKVRGGILIGILIISILTWYLESSFPHKFVTLPTLTLGHADYINFSELEFGKCFSAVVAFVFIGIIDVSGVMFGMARLANLTLIDDTVPGSMYAFVGVSVSTVLGACMGSTPVIIYVESAAGIKEGGRTGLTAVVISFFFVLSLFLAPLFSSIPVTATSSVSILVGVLMMSQAREIDWDDLSSAIPAFLTMTLIPFTFSITNGIMFGLLAALFFYFSTGKVIKDLERFSNHPHINRSSLGYITVPEQSVHSELFQVVHGNDHFEIAEPASTCSITSSPEDGRVNIM
jgi:AGZA family xanthine/uracil permease-like MFS transporter